MSQPTGNLAASVRQRLMNLAHTRGEPFQTLLTRYAIERLLYRLSQSEEADRFLLKGALLFLLWSDTPHRATRDIDLLGRGNPAIEPLVTLFRSLCVLNVPDDGLRYLEETVQAAAIREDNIYGGVRVTLTARLENARIPVQVDIGFGDSIIPEPVTIVFPTLLDFPAPLLRAYQRETVIAEKLQALVVLEIDNSRMKDFYDLYILGTQFAFEGPRLCEAVANTFLRRETPLPMAVPVGLTDTFAQDVKKQSQWSAFLRRQHLTAGVLPLEDVLVFLSDFLWPVIEAARENKLLDRRWSAGGPWRVAEEQA